MERNKKVTEVWKSQHTWRGTMKTRMSPEGSQRTGLLNNGLLHKLVTALLLRHFVTHLTRDDWETRTIRDLLYHDQGHPQEAHNSGGVFNSVVGHLCSMCEALTNPQESWCSVARSISYVRTRTWIGIPSTTDNSYTAVCACDPGVESRDKWILGLIISTITMTRISKTPGIEFPKKV